MTALESRHIARAMNDATTGTTSMVGGSMVKRASDGGTAGGNAYSGNSNDASGGSVGNESTSTTAAQTNGAAGVGAVPGTAASTC